jgi:hypothetical protein
LVPAPTARAIIELRDSGKKALSDCRRRSIAA